VGPTTYDITVPGAQTTLTSGATRATTTFNAATNTWVTTAPPSFSGNVFLDGVALKVPAGGLPGGINPVTMTLDFASSNPIGLNWQWAAAAYTSFDTYDSLGVKPSDSPTSLYPNSNAAGTPESFEQFVTGGARGGGGSNFTGSLSPTAALSIPGSPPPPPPPGIPAPPGLVLGLLGVGVCLLARRYQRRPTTVRCDLDIGGAIHPKPDLAQRHRRGR
jgi:hypothetical protein